MKFLACYNDDWVMIEENNHDQIIYTIKKKLSLPVNCTISLKVFDKDWEEWIKKEPSEIKDKDKIKVTTVTEQPFSPLVQPLQVLNFPWEPAAVHTLSSPSTSISSIASESHLKDLLSSCSSESEVNSSHTESISQNLPSDSLLCEESDLLDVKPSESNGTLSEGPGRDKVKVQERDKVQERVTFTFKPWPVHLKIPKENMSPQLRHTLQRGVFPSDKLRLHLIQVIFDYMWQFGSHPTRLQYEQMAQLLVKEYPCLAQTSVPAAKPYDYWKLKLSDKFRNERKSMGSASLTGNKQHKKVKKLPPDPNPGEDAESLTAHVRWMKDEFKKRTPDWERVKKLMVITFEDRRKDINNNMLIPVMKEKYPFMFTVTEIHNEFTRITSVSHTVNRILENIKPLLKAILEYPTTDKEVLQFREIAATKVESCLTVDKAEEMKTLCALYVLPAVFKQKPSLIMGKKDEQVEGNMSPFLLISSDVLEADDFTVQCENEVVVKTKSLVEGIALLTEVYWIFNMKYPKQTRDVFNFIACCLLKMDSVKPTRCVSSALTKMASRG